MPGKYNLFKNETESDAELNSASIPASSFQPSAPESRQLHSVSSSSNPPEQNGSPNVVGADVSASPENIPCAAEAQGQQQLPNTNQFGPIPYGHISMTPGVTAAVPFPFQPVYQIGYNQPVGPFPTDSEQYKVREEAQARGISTPYELLSQKMRDDIRKKVLREQCPECGKFGSFKAEWTALYMAMSCFIVTAVVLGSSVFLICFLLMMCYFGCGCAYVHDGGCECGCLKKYRRRRCKQCGHTAGDKRLKLMTGLFALIVFAEIGGIMGFIFHAKRSADADNRRFQTNWQNIDYGYTQNRFTSTYRSFGDNDEVFTTDQLSINFHETTAVPTYRVDSNKPTMFTGKRLEKKLGNFGSLGEQGFEVSNSRSIAPSTKAPQMKTQSLEINFGPNDMDKIWQSESEKPLSDNSTSNINISNITTTTTTVIVQHYLMSSNTTSSSEPMLWTQKKKHHAAVGPTVGMSG